MPADISAAGVAGYAHHEHGNAAFCCNSAHARDPPVERCRVGAGAWGRAHGTLTIAMGFVPAVKGEPGTSSSAPDSAMAKTRIMCDSKLLASWAT